MTLMVFVHTVPANGLLHDGHQAIAWHNADFFSIAI